VVPDGKDSMNPRTNSIWTKAISAIRRQRSKLHAAATFGLLAGVAVLIIGPAGCNYAGDMETADASGDKQMNRLNRDSNPESGERPGIPPIDRDVPGNLQTATFALG
jgi:hypothetical protein